RGRSVPAREVRPGTQRPVQDPIDAPARVRQRPPGQRLVEREVSAPLGARTRRRVVQRPSRGLPPQPRARPRGSGLARRRRARLPPRGPDRTARLAPLPPPGRGPAGFNGTSTEAPGGSRAGTDYRL